MLKPVSELWRALCWLCRVLAHATQLQARAGNAPEGRTAPHERAGALNSGYQRAAATHPPRCCLSMQAGVTLLSTVCAQGPPHLQDLCRQQLHTSAKTCALKGRHWSRGRLVVTAGACKQTGRRAGRQRAQHVRSAPGTSGTAVARSCLRVSGGWRTGPLLRTHAQLMACTRVAIHP
jgi:hypothetical protein